MKGRPHGTYGTGISTPALPAVRTGLQIGHPCRDLITYHKIYSLFEGMNAVLIRLLKNH